MILEKIRSAESGDDLAREWDRAFNQAMRSLASEPDPAEIEPWLTTRQSAALFGAASQGGLHITAPHSSDGDLMHGLRMAGLVEVKGNHLTARGTKVRRIIVERGE